MDLHLTADRPTPEERAAVDRELDDNIQPPRHKLLPVLHAVQARIGHISPGAINHVAARMDIAPAEIFGVASFYGLFSLAPQPRVVAHVCNDIVCLTHGAATVCKEIEKTDWPPGVAWKLSPCLGLCERAPAALITSAGGTPLERTLAPATAEAVRAATEFEKNEAKPWNAAASVPQAGQPQLRLLHRIGKADPESLEDYRSLGGFQALKKAVELGPEDVIREVIASRLLGRGGAAFPTGKKWEAVLKRWRPGATHYVVCNADESEPGTFKDRVIMEGDPFAVIEGITIAAFATHSSYGYVYIRGEYPLAAARMQRAIELSRAEGLLGKSFDIEIRRGAGAYICGEETALFNSIEGYRGEPRNKPPFPAEAGLFRRPTVVNNVETLINVPLIILEGGAAYARIGTEQSAGYRLFCLCGHIARPGVYEIPFGVTLGEMIQLAGGVGGNGRLQAVLLGGAAGTFVSPSELETPLTFEGTRAVGATLGSGVIMPIDDSVDLKQILLRIASFFREESCGQCVPCRAGVVRQEEALERLIHNQPLGSTAEEIRTLREMGQAMRDASICGLGQTASSAIESALNRWSLFS